MSNGLRLKKLAVIHNPNATLTVPQIPRGPKGFRRRKTRKCGTSSRHQKVLEERNRAKRLEESYNKGWVKRPIL